MRVPVPREIAQDIASDAARLAKEYGQRRKWSAPSFDSFVPVAEEGLVGIRTTVKHVAYQNTGTKPFVMWWAEGRIIPLPSGPILATRVGQEGWGYQDRKDKAKYPHTGRIWREQRWRHPGIDRTGFMQDSLRKAIKQSEKTLQRRTREILAGRARDGGT